MHDTSEVEAILARLMPAAMSQGGQEDIEAMLDELAGPPVETPEKIVRFPWLRRIVTGGIAAAGLAAAWILSMGSPDAPLVASHSAKLPPEFVLVSESDRIEKMTDEGWQEDTDGSAMRALRLNVVEENSLLDEETGIVMQVSEPREEILLMPISAF